MLFEEVISHYRKSAPCIVTEKYWNRKKDKGSTMMPAMYVAAAVGEKACLGQSDIEQ